MVKVNTICRDRNKKGTSQEINQINRNPGFNQHPFQQAREYVRAMNSVKLERIFAKPFIFSMEGHRDGVSVLAKNKKSLIYIASGSFDGEVKIWNLSERKSMFEIPAHKGFVRGLAFTNNNSLLSSGDDSVIRLWNMNKVSSQVKSNIESPQFEYYSSKSICNLDITKEENIFATSGTVVQLWNFERSKPIQSLEWNIDSIIKVKFNHSETNLLLSSCQDRSICLYDIRGKTPLQKVFLANKSNALCWNPYIPLEFVVGNDDSNAYTFDIRRLDKIKLIHKDHINSILDIDFAPTGREFVSGSFDKTLRIFPHDQGKSREIYHTKRMQQIEACLYTMDGKFVISGSDDTNIRIWKSNASDPLKPLLPREKAKLDYSSKLKKKFSHNPEIKRLLRHRHMPKYLVFKKGQRQVQLESKKRKQKNLLNHSKIGDIIHIPEKEARIREVEK